MTGSFPTRPDGLVDGTRVPHDALTSEGSCTHEHAARVVAHREGCDDVWSCPCGDRWTVSAGAPALPPLRRFPADVEENHELPLLCNPHASINDLVRQVVTVPDTTTGPSGLLARFRNRTRKA